jgi:hypothetical protein
VNLAILERRNGVLVADEVGLGKTFLAGELIRQAVQERRQRVLVVAPATLRDGPWRKFLLDFQLGVECISYEELREGRYQYRLEEYALVVVDEGHNLRNPGTERARALRELLAGTPPKQLVLLTATPVNNSLWDLYYLLAYFVKSDSPFASVGIRWLRGHFARAMALDPDDLSPEHLFDVLDDVSVRRTRPFVKRYYPNDRVVIDGVEVPITFPKPRPLTIGYKLDEALPGFFRDSSDVGRDQEVVSICVAPGWRVGRPRREPEEGRLAPVTITGGCGDSPTIGGERWIALGLGEQEVHDTVDSVGVVAEDESGVNPSVSASAATSTRTLASRASFGSGSALTGSL